ncbi:YtxH domain-containing protein [Rufibacter radiotolerans]|uniref:YtxH domain-containing protein n=1 Tax=Rufibacter radiotolerans TaxID=1379910 RepID=UPI0006647491|nr:YtxH domain-containing protein [Rufibacter radiotolerans]
MKNDNSKVLLAAAAGAAAGVVVGILMAPSNGKDSRENLMKIAGQVAEGVNGQIGAYIEKFGGLASLLGGSEGSDATTTSVGADASTGATADEANARS